MNEWLIERTYEKQIKSDAENAPTSSFNSTNGSAIHEIVCLSKYIGFDYVSPVSFESQKLELTTRSKHEVSSIQKKSDIVGVSDISSNNTETELDIEELFDCVYVTVTSNSLTPFAVTSNSARPSPAPSPL